MSGEPMIDLEKTLPRQLRERASLTPDRPWMHEVGGRRATFAECHRESLLWADVFRGLGVQRGDRIATMLGNSIDGQMAWVGAAWIGALEVPLSPLLRGPSLVHMLENSGAKVVVTTADLLARLDEVSLDLKCLERVIVIGEPEPFPDRSIAVLSCDELLGAASASDTYDAPGIHDVSCVLYTSGTTGPSKGVLVPWGQLMAGAVAVPLDELGESEVFYYTGASNHVGARGQPYLLAALGGQFVMRPAFSTEAFWHDVDSYGCTWTLLVGAMAHYIQSLPPSPDDAKHPLRRAIMAPLLPNLEEFCRRFDLRVTTAFSMTEISAPITLGRWVTRADPRSCGRRREGWPFYDVRVVDDLDREVPEGTVGELVVRTGTPWTLNQGYLGNAEATVRAWRNGWFHTGDAFRRDREGNYYFVDRIKDSIRKGGENVSSFEVEAVANLHPAVVESAAVAVPATTAEDEIKLFVVVKPGTRIEMEELIGFLAAKMPRFMVPRFVEVITELPKTPTQRVRKADLRTRPTGKVWDREVAGIRLPR